MAAVTVELTDLPPGTHAQQLAFVALTTPTGQTLYNATIHAIVGLKNEPVPVVNVMGPDAAAVARVVFGALGRHGGLQTSQSTGGIPLADALRAPIADGGGLRATIDTVYPLLLVAESRGVDAVKDRLPEGLTLGDGTRNVPICGFHMGPAGVGVGEPCASGGPCRWTKSTKCGRFGAGGLIHARLGPARPDPTGVALTAMAPPAGRIELRPTDEVDDDEDDDAADAAGRTPYDA
jgi:hypothetical protein